jgi:hypothetical protein
MTAKAEIPPAKGTEIKVFGRTPKSAWRPDSEGAP